MKGKHLQPQVLFVTILLANNQHKLAKTLSYNWNGNFSLTKLTTSCKPADVDEVSFNLLTLNQPKNLNQNMVRCEKTK